MIDVIIFSKNRACQLDALICSIEKHWINYKECSFHVIYTYDNDNFKKGYDILIKDYSLIHWIKESESFKNDIVEIDYQHNYITFLTDDDVFKEDFDTNTLEFDIFQYDESILCLSLRLGLHIDNHYIKGASPAPDGLKSPCIWDWRKGNIDWGYPMSISGAHIYKRADLSASLKELYYDKAWNIECALAAYPINKPKMICYETSKVFHNPINRVQVGIINKCGDVTAESLNAEFLKGKRIDINKLSGYKNSSVHEIVDVELI